MPIFFDGRAFEDPERRPLAAQDAMEWSDFARAHGIRNPLPPGLLTTNGDRILALLGQAQAALGCRLVVTSFYRSPVLNARVGGKVQPPSAHMDLRAVDFLPSGLDLDEAFATLRGGDGEGLPFDQLIIEHDSGGSCWIHISVPRAGVAPRRMAFALEKQLVVDRQHPG